VLGFLIVRTVQHYSSLAVLWRICFFTLMCSTADIVNSTKTIGHAQTFIQ
jgi:hypothetical protein